MVNQGLEGVVVAETELSEVDGAGGELWIRGWPLHRVAALGGLEGALALLWRGEAPQPADQQALGAARVQMAEEVAQTPPLQDGASFLRAALARLEGADPIQLVAACGEALVRFQSQRARRPWLPPDPARAHAADLAARLSGEDDPWRGEALGVYLAVVAEHGFNASTFAARVVVSTGSDDTSAVVAALGALKGPLHGGAPGPVLDMLEAVGSPERAEAWVEAELAAGRRIMGVGHRVYRVRDPRVAVLEAEIARHVAAGHLVDPLPLAKAVEAAAVRALARRHPNRALAANVEFATALLLSAVGVDRAAFTACFAAGRVVGWLAHAAEQRAHGRLIRPSARYVGPRLAGDA